MKLLSLGPDEFNQFDLESLQAAENQLSYEIEKFIYWYRDGGYEGDGCAIFKDTNDSWHIIDLNHCSCFGPVEDLKSVPMAKEQVLDLLAKHYRYYDDRGRACRFKKLIAYLEAEDA